MCQERCEWPIVGVCRFSILVRSSCLGCVCDRYRNCGKESGRRRLNSGADREVVGMCVCLSAVAPFTLPLSSGFTTQQANRQTIHPYLPCSMPIPVDWRELDSHTSRGELFSI